MRARREAKKENAERRKMRREERGMPTYEGVISRAESHRQHLERTPRLIREKAAKDARERKKAPEAKKKKPKKKPADNKAEKKPAPKGGKK